MKRNNNIDKEIYSAPTLKEALKIAMSETPLEEFEMDVIQTLSQYDDWKRDNPGKSYDDFLKEMGLDRVKLNAGGLSREALIHMLKNEYPKEYARLKKGNLSQSELKKLLDNLDKDGVPFNTGGLVSNYKKNARKP